MCSSKIDHEAGIVTITTPDAYSSVGDRFYVIGSAATYGIGYSSWVLRLLDPLPPWRGQTSGTPNHELAQERLLESLQNGTVHPSLAAEPPESLVEPPAQAAA